MARNSLSVVLFSVVLMAVAASGKQITVGHTSSGAPITVDVVEPTVGNSKQGDKPVVTKPDEVFTGNFPVANVQAGTKDGKPVISGRKMLDVTVAGTSLHNGVPATDPVRDLVEPDTLDLRGSGEQVGDSTAGAGANAYGHGHNEKTGGTHIEPHGVNGDASAAGKGVNGVKANVNPDGLGGEGDVAQVGR